MWATARDGFNMAVSLRFDVIIIGGGPAGLSAALVLGRARRRVVVIDGGRPRNASSRALHGFLSRDGTNPAEFLHIARGELSKYPTVSMVRGEAVHAARCDDGDFLVRDALGRAYAGRKLLMATGVVDDLPDIPRFEDFYGVSIHHCPYCDGFEHRDEPLLVTGPAANCAGLALMMKRWSHDVAFVPDDPETVTAQVRSWLGRAAVDVIPQRIVTLEGVEGRLQRVMFEDGTWRSCAAIFFNTGQHQRSPLLAALGVDFTSKGGVATDRREETLVDGLFVAGDATRDVQFVVVAAGEGATAAVAIDKALMHEDGVI